MEDEPDETASPSTTAVTAADTPAGTPVPGLALTPRPGVIADMPTARRYEAEGDIEAAAEAYVAIAASQSPDRVEATLAAARLLMDNGDYADARTLLEPFVEAQTGTPEGSSGTYLLARAYTGLDMWPEALAQFDTYIAGDGPAEAYAYLDRSYTLLELQRAFEAAESAQMALNAAAPTSLTPALLLASAQSYERAGAFTDAIGYYNLLMGEGASYGDTALALQRIASLKEILGDPTYTVERDRLLAEYPSSYQALVALQEAEAAGEAIDPIVHGLVLYRQNEYTLAQPHFEEQIEAFPEAPETAIAYYYLGAIVESRAELDQALANYELVDLYDPASDLADDALWWRARIHENEGEFDDASSLYSRIVEEYPFSSFAADAAFRRGMLAYRAGAYLESAQIWEADLATVGDDAERERLHLWQAKALLQAGQPDAALSVFEALSANNGDEYFGIRALGLREGLHEHYPTPPETDVHLSPEWDWEAAEQWLASVNAGVARNTAWQTDPQWLRAQELWRIGRTYYGDLEILELVDANGADPAALYTLSRELLAEGRISMSARTGQRLLSLLDAGVAEGLPKPLMSLAYPAAFGPLVQRYAEAEDVSPLLMLAFIRQESFFNPRAQSPVGALGLTQLLPESAQIAASALGITSEVPNAQLLHADLNLRLGAKFMASQLERFDGELFVALAAYNGGPTSAMRWDEAAGDDADIFLETIEYAESRHYVEIVAENYAIYRYIYGGEPEPNLPR